MTTFAQDGESKTVIDDMGYLASMSKSVGELEIAIDAPAGTAKCVGPNQRVAMPPSL